MEEMGRVADSVAHDMAKMAFTSTRVDEKEETHCDEEASKVAKSTLAAFGEQHTASKGRKIKHRRTGSLCGFVPPSVPFLAETGRARSEPELRSKKPPAYRGCKSEPLLDTTALSAALRAVEEERKMPPPPAYKSPPPFFDARKQMTEMGQPRRVLKKVLSFRPKMLTFEGSKAALVHEFLTAQGLDAEREKTVHNIFFRCFTDCEEVKYEDGKLSFVVKTSNSNHWGAIYNQRMTKVDRERTFALFTLKVKFDKGKQTFTFYSNKRENRITHFDKVRPGVVREAPRGMSRAVHRTAEDSFMAQVADMSKLRRQRGLEMTLAPLAEGAILEEKEEEEAPPVTRERSHSISERRPSDHAAVHAAMRAVRGDKELAAPTLRRRRSSSIREGRPGDQDAVKKAMADIAKALARPPRVEEVEDGVAAMRVGPAEDISGRPRSHNIRDGRPRDAAAVKQAFEAVDLAVQARREAAKEVDE